MILKYLNLCNIRSYISQRIEFPNGSVMLSGDVGSGKSTILLAIEFALFGIMKGDVSAESLLRNGKREGSVELCFMVNNKEVIINRVLKKSKQGVKQEAGWIIIDRVKKAGTSTELRAVVIELLGYPKEYVTKSKGMIYRYTVYTPQEEMKKILFEDKEARLNTLRRVFDVDKYRRIRENSKIYIYELRGKTREIEGFISDIEEKKKQLGERAHEVSDVEIRLKELAPRLKIAKEFMEKCGKDAQECEKEISKLVKMKNELALCDSELRSIVNQRQRNNADIEALGKRIESLKKEIGEKSGEAIDLKAVMKEKENAMRFMQDTKLKISRKVAEMTAIKRSAGDTKTKISKLDNCPLCLQEVSHEHKKSIISRENEKISKLENEIRIHSAQEKEADSKIIKLRKELEELRKKEIAAEAAKAKINELKEKMQIVERLTKEQDAIKKSIGEINLKKIKLSGEIGLLKDIDKKYSEIKKRLEEAREEEHLTAINCNTLETERKEKLAIVGALEKEVKEKEEAKQKLGNTRDIQHWLETHFISLMALMEKQVMAKVYHSFNELFQNWFNMLIEDEAISARLDDSFTPLIHQNGYDTNIDFLSGGEKTSCALAYRLSLNRVINDLISTIQTKDLIILDEPTDGFSTEQLDRVREVIEQLNMNQVIIVSHEQKIEGFVDNVIRIQKNEHISSAIV